MIDLVIATKNKNKVKEIKHLLKNMPINVFSLEDGKWEIPHIVEDGKTFKENAIKKAKTIAGITGKVTLADDSGLEVDALAGQPGIISARFSGENATDRENNIKLLNMMKDVSEDRRGAQFRSAIAIASPEGVVEVVEGTCRGEIGFSEKGGQGFGYDPLFIPAGYNKTFAELSLDIKNKISHRGRALEKAKLILERFLLFVEEK
jgi:XTP/dITP diphosphohydrolase